MTHPRSLLSGKRWTRTTEPEGADLQSAAIATMRSSQYLVAAKVCIFFFSAKFLLIFCEKQRKKRLDCRTEAIGEWPIKKIHNRKNSDTPATEIMAPTTLLKVMGCLKSQRAGKMMMMGVSAIKVLAMPALVY